jgi:hypothetical protein
MAPTFAAWTLILLLSALTAAARTPQPQEEKLEAAHSALAEGFESFQKGRATQVKK